MERRSYPRITVFSKAGLHTSGTESDILLLDMSRTGARIMMPAGKELAMDTTVAIKLGVLPTFVGRVNRIDGRVCGVQLVDKLHPTVVECARQFCRGGELGELARRA